MKQFLTIARVSPLLAVLLLSFASCKKEAAVQPAQAIHPATDGMFVEDRTQDNIVAGVQVYDPFIASTSEVVVMDEVTGAVLYTLPVFMDFSGTQVQLRNLKGICRFGPQYFLTTGVEPPSVSPINLSNSLYKFNIVTGQAGLISTSPNNIGTVSDIDYNPLDQTLYGLANNSNTLVAIPSNGANFNVYNPPTPIAGIAGGYTLNGLTLMRDNFGMYMVGAARRPGATTRIYSLGPLMVSPVLTGFMTDLDPALEFNNSHSGIGFDIEFNHLMVNRNAPGLLASGLNDFAWTPPFAALTPTAHWGGLTYNFEDLSTYIGTYW